MEHVLTRCQLDVTLLWLGVKKKGRTCISGSGSGSRSRNRNKGGDLANLRGLLLLIDVANISPPVPKARQDETRRDKTSKKNDQARESYTPVPLARTSLFFPFPFSFLPSPFSFLGRTSPFHMHTLIHTLSLLSKKVRT